MADDDLLIQIDIKDNLDQVLRGLKEFHADQLPFAQSVALFNVALDAKETMLQQIPKVFTIRTGKRAWATRALYVFPIKSAHIKKNIVEGKDASVMVATQDDLGRKLTDGGTKEHKQGKRLGVPLPGGGRKNRMTVTRPGRNFPIDIEQNKKGFYIPLKSGDALLVIRKRNKKKGEDDKVNLQKMFYMKTKVKIKPWWNLRDIWSQAMLTWLPKRFEEACEKAMATRRPTRGGG